MLGMVPRLYLIPQKPFEVGIVVSSILQIKENEAQRG